MTPKKYPGGYQIIDMKGLVVELDADPVALSKDISKRLVEALDNSKPILLTNLSSDDVPEWTFLLDTNNVLGGDSATYVLFGNDGSPLRVWEVYFSNYDDPEATISYKQI